MRITLVGPGRAGTAIALAARAAGHDIMGVMARRPEAASSTAARLGAPLAAGLDDDVPPCDLLVVATRDDAIEAVAGRLAGHAGGVRAAVHLSGLAGTRALDPLAAAGPATGSFHPLQTIPTPEAGAERLRGAWIGITAADEHLHETLVGLAVSLGARPFDLADDVKALYHAAAAAAANYPLAALAMAADLFAGAGVPFAAAKPLVEAVVANAFDLGPRAALTGPVARGDVRTVQRQLEAVDAAAPQWSEGFRGFAAQLAAMTGRSEAFDHLLDGRRT